MPRNALPTYGDGSERVHLGCFTKQSVFFTRAKKERNGKTATRSRVISFLAGSQIRYNALLWSSGKATKMAGDSDISALYREFTDALTEVLAENSVGPARRGRLARAHAAVKKHPNFNEHEYFLAVEAAFSHWEAIQNVGR
jgi:hypothetical protein